MNVNIICIPFHICPEKINNAYQSFLNLTKLSFAKGGKKNKAENQTNLNHSISLS